MGPKGGAIHSLAALSLPGPRGPVTHSRRLFKMPEPGCDLLVIVCHFPVSHSGLRAKSTVGAAELGAVSERGERRLSLTAGPTGLMPLQATAVFLRGTDSLCVPAPFPTQLLPALCEARLRPGVCAKPGRRSWNASLDSGPRAGKAAKTAEFTSANKCLL